MALTEQEKQLAKASHFFNAHYWGAPKEGL
jgi:hypothetical protein